MGSSSSWSSSSWSSSWSSSSWSSASSSSSPCVPAHRHVVTIASGITVALVSVVLCLALSVALGVAVCSVHSVAWPGWVAPQSTLSGLFYLSVAIAWCLRARKHQRVALFEWPPAPDGHLSSWFGDYRLLSCLAWPPERTHARPLRSFTWPQSPQQQFIFQEISASR